MGVMTIDLFGSQDEPAPYEEKPSKAVCAQDYDLFPDVYPELQIVPVEQEQTDTDEILIINSILGF